jgi:S-(hydroxymethyl)glutathione dehydrogenase / alcohol dehydrogenase
MRRMRAAMLIDGTNDLQMVEITLGELGPREVRLRTEAVGLCHSDLHCIDGTLNRPRPLLLGHEAVGVVEAIGSGVRSVAVGDRVVTCLVQGCGACIRCIEGEPNVCMEPTSTKRAAGLGPRVALADGTAVAQMAGIAALAEQLITDERGVVKIGNDIPGHLAAILGCAVVTGLGAVFNVARVRPTETVAVIGCGGVGLNVIQGARIAGASRIIAIDLSPSKLALARKLGATDTIDPSSTDLLAAVKAITGEGVDHAFEVVGRPATIAQALDIAAVGRTAYVVGVLADDAEVTVPAMAFRRGKSLKGVFMGSTRPQLDIPRYITLWEQGLLDLATMVSGTISLDQAGEGFHALARGEVARTVVTL